MSGHPTADQLRRFVSGELAAAEVAETSRHVSACAECRAAAEPIAGIHAAAVARDLASEEWHPTPDEIAAFATSRVSPADSEAIESHVEVCARCAEDVADIREIARPRSRPARLAIAAMLGAMALLLPLWIANRTPVVKPPDSTQQPALIVERLEMPEVLRTLRPKGSVLRTVGGSEWRTSSMSPAGVVVESDRPRFSWPAVEGAVDYRVIVFSGSVEVARSARMRSTEWRPPSTLARGRTYEWQVVVATAKGDVVIPPPEAPAALFAVLSETAAKEISAAAKDPLGAGMLYARAGVVDRAEEKLRAYAAAHPRSAAAQNLHRTVAEWRRW